MAAELNDTWLELKTVFKGFTVQVGAYFTPLFQYMLDSFLYVINNWKRLIAEATKFIFNEVSELYDDLAYLAENFSFGLVSDDKIQEFKDAAYAMRLAAIQTGKTGVPGIGIDPYVPFGEDVKLGLSGRSQDLKDHGVYGLLEPSAKVKAAGAMSTGAWGASSAQLQKSSRDNTTLMMNQVDELKEANDQLGTIINKMNKGGVFA